MRGVPIMIPNGRLRPLLTAPPADRIAIAAGQARAPMGRASAATNPTIHEASVLQRLADVAAAAYVEASVEPLDAPNVKRPGKVQCSLKGSRALTAIVQNQVKLHG